MQNQITNKFKASQKTITNANMKSDIDEGQRLEMSQLSGKHLMVEKHKYKSNYRCMYSKRPIRYAFRGSFFFVLS